MRRGALPRRAVAVGVAAAAVLLLAGCAAPPAAFGSTEGVTSLQCAHLAAGERVLVGDELEVGGTSVTVRSAGLKDARGVRVLRSWVLRQPPGGVGVGTVVDPPTGRTAEQLGWATRVPAVGAVLPAHAQRDVVLEVQKTASTASTGSAADLHVEVSAEGALFGAVVGTDSGTAYRFPGRCP